MTRKLYTERRFLRTLEKGWVSVEGVINRFVKSDFNPFIPGHMTIFMLGFDRNWRISHHLVSPRREWHATVEKISSELVRFAGERTSLRRMQ
jgi:hypothetical protein